MKKIIGIGNALIDMLIPLKDDHVLVELSLPKGSMQLLDDDTFARIQKRIATLPHQRATGGSVSNAMLALANLGAAPAFIGKVGNDPNGRFFSENAQHKGMVPYLATDALSTGIAHAFITPDGQRTFGTYLGAAARLTADDLNPSWLEGYDLLFIEGYLVQNHHLILRAAQLAKAAGLETAIDLSSYNIVEEERDFFTQLLPLIDIVFANEEESYAYTQLPPNEAVAALAKICQTAVVKVGAHGVWVQQGKHCISTPALAVERVVDTTGAGDFFAAGFLYGYATGQDIEAAARLGSLLAGHVVQHLGTTLPSPIWEEIRAQL